MKSIKEEWKKYLDTDYWVSSRGRIKGPHGILKPYSNTSGYLQVGIFFGKNKRKKMFLHRIVAECWKHNPNGYKYIHHIDENTSSTIDWNQARMQIALEMAKFISKESKAIRIKDLAARSVEFADALIEELKKQNLG